MKLSDYLASAPRGWNDDYGLRPFARSLLEARSHARELCAILGGLVAGPSVPDAVVSLSAARRSATQVANFFATEYHLGKRARLLTREILHLETHVSAFGWTDWAAGNVVELSEVGQALHRFLAERGAAEVATAFGRARTLHDNGPFIVIGAGVAASGFMFGTTMTVLAVYMPPQYRTSGIAVWLGAALAILFGAACAVQVGLIIASVLRGDRVVVAWPMVRFALQFVPRCHRSRYHEEFRSELNELAAFGQIRYALSLISHVLELRSSLSVPDEQSTTTMDEI